MLNECAHNISTLFRTSRILHQPLYNALLDLDTSVALCICDFDQCIKDTLDRKRLGFLERQALPLFRFKRDIACVAVLVVQLFQGRIVESTDLFECF